MHWIFSIFFNLLDRYRTSLSTLCLDRHEDSVRFDTRRWSSTMSPSTFLFCYDSDRGMHLTARLSFRLQTQRKHLFCIMSPSMAIQFSLVSPVCILSRRKYKRYKKMWMFELSLQPARSHLIHLSKLSAPNSSSSPPLFINHGPARCAIYCLYLYLCTPLTSLCVSCFCRLHGGAQYASAVPP